MENLSPMLQQYLKMKEEVGSDTLLFFRLGDFYELFFEDAEIAANELELILTSRAAGNNQKAPMCGVPHHAAHSYIQRLISKGYKVAIAQQMEDPSEAKGLVKRAVTKIITQGTNFDNDENETSYLASISSDLFNIYIALYDITSNELIKTQIEKDTSQLMTLLVQHHVKEVLIDDSMEKEWLKENTDLVISTHPIKKKVSSEKEKAELQLKEYLAYTQKQTIKPRLSHLNQETMKLDFVSLSNLELLEVERVNSRSHSLFDYLNKTNTSMGTRELKEWIKFPLLKEEDIKLRADRITYLIENYLIQHKLVEFLKQIYDISRIATKIEYKTANAQDLNRLRISIEQFNGLKELFNESDFLSVFENVQVDDVKDLIETQLEADAPAIVGSTPTIKIGVNTKLDDYRSTLSDSNQWLLNYELEQKERTSIKNLKVGYSRQFGYYLEVSKGQLGLVKEEYGFIRRQTLTNAERFYTIELKAQEEKILEATTQLDSLESTLLDKLINTLQTSVDRVRKLAAIIAQIDCLSALSIISGQPGFTRVQFTKDRSIKLIESSHPILEYSMKTHQIISNDYSLEPDQDVMILTGPNMGGKSTYMRQIAISIIMAQMGCYVKAKEAHLPLFDGIYTRMGASDDIMSGHSTFMIEMIETNTAISRATSNSFILFDEIGRGTSTHDGMAIASSILEYVATKIKARCIFSTHYHELTQLAQNHDNMVNAQVSVAEKDQEITFLYEVKPGSANRSYGIHVAALADLPTEIIKKANQRLLSAQASNNQDNSIDYSQQVIQIPSKVSKRLKEVDINKLTPLDALTLLNELVAINESEDNE